MKRALFALVLVSGCLDFADTSARCASLKSDLMSCLDVDDLPLNCGSYTQTDLDNLQLMFDTVGCTALVSEAPLDGDSAAIACRLFGEGCVSAINDALPLDVARYPIVFVNGIDVSPLFSWSPRVLNEVKATGNIAELAVVPPYDATDRRANVLYTRIQELKQAHGTDKVNLICHSLGGLDCRYLVSPNGLALDLGLGREEIARDVASITTVSTAHDGTPIADRALGFLPNGDAERAISALATSLGSWLADANLEDNVRLRASLLALSRSQAQSFNAEIIDAEAVFYQSFGGLATPAGKALEDPRSADAACAPDEDFPFSLGEGTDFVALPLVDSYAVVLEEDSERSDGLCPVDSARHGLFRGCILADHMEQLGRKNLPDVNQRTRLDIARFYAQVVAELARRGF